MSGKPLIREKTPPTTLSDFIDRVGVDDDQAHRLARGISWVLDLPLLGVYDLANEEDPVEDPDWLRVLLGNGWIVIYEGVTER